MEEKKKATITAAKRQGLHHKYSNNQRIIATISGLFLAGRKLTAKEINDITGSNDARKVISTLRRDRWRIVDVLQPDRCKLYWLEQKDRQLNLWEEQG